MWPSALSGRLPIVALVSHYLTNKLIGRGLLLQRLSTFPFRAYAVLAPVSQGYSPLKGRLPTCYSPVRHCTQGLLPFLVRLACVKRAASVDSEPGSNSRLISLRYQSPQLNSNFRGSRLRPTRLSKIFAAGRGSRRKPNQPQASKPLQTALRHALVFGAENVTAENCKNRVELWGSFRFPTRFRASSLSLSRASMLPPPSSSRKGRLGNSSGWKTQEANYRLKATFKE